MSPRSSVIHYPTVLTASQQADITNLTPIERAPDKNPFLQEKLEPLANDQVIMQQQDAPQYPMYEKLTASPVILSTAICSQLFCCIQNLARTEYSLRSLVRHGFFNSPDLCHQIINEFAIRDITAKQTDITLVTKDYDLHDPITFDSIICVTFDSNDAQQIYAIAKETLETKHGNISEELISEI